MSPVVVSGRALEIAEKKVRFQSEENLGEKYTVRKRKKINNPGNSSHAGIELFHRNVSVLDIVHRIKKSVVIVFCHFLQKLPNRKRGLVIQLPGNSTLM